MAEVKIAPISNEEKQTGQMVEMFNRMIRPDNPNVRFDDLDSCLDGLLLLRATLIDCYHQEVDKVRETIREEEKQAAIQVLNDRMETKVAFEKRVTVSTPGALKAVIRGVKAYDHLKDNQMGRIAFIKYCEKQGIGADEAELIWVSQAYDIEKRRTLINDNLMMLAE